MSQAQAVGWRVIGTGSGLLATKVSKSVLDKAWARTRGGEPPRNPAAPGTTWSEALLWAVASGVVVAVVRLVVTRGAAEVWERVTGSLPPGLEDVG